MPDLKPTFSLTIGGLRSSTATPAGGPDRFVVQRDMDAAGDALRVRLADRSGVAPGDDVTLDLGHDGTEQPVFAGIVTRVQPGVAGIDVQALGGLHEMLRVPVAAAYEEQTAGAIARDLAGRAGVATGTIEDGPTLPRFVADGRRSAHAHLRSLADRLGFELYADVAGKLMFHALGAAAGAPPPGPPEGLEYGGHLLALRAVRRPPALAGVAVSGESPMSAQGDGTVAWLTTDPADFRGQSGDAGGPLVVDAVARTKDLADLFAAGILAVGARAANTIRVTALGRPQIDLGDAVDVSGHPDALAAGSGYVRALCHRFDGARGFVTELTVATEGSA